MRSTCFKPASWPWKGTLGQKAFWTAEDPSQSVECVTLGIILSCSSPAASARIGSFLQDLKKRYRNVRDRIHRLRHFYVPSGTSKNDGKFFAVFLRSLHLQYASTISTVSTVGVYQKTSQPWTATSSLHLTHLDPATSESSDFRPCFGHLGPIVGALHVLPWGKNLSICLAEHDWTISTLDAVRSTAT